MKPACLSGGLFCFLSLSTYRTIIEFLITIWDERKQNQYFPFKQQYHRLYNVLPFLLYAFRGIFRFIFLSRKD